MVSYVDIWLLLSLSKIKSFLEIKSKTISPLISLYELFQTCEWTLKSPTIMYWLGFRESMAFWMSSNWLEMSANGEQYTLNRHKFWSFSWIKTVFNEYVVKVLISNAIRDLLFKIIALLGKSQFLSKKMSNFSGNPQILWSITYGSWMKAMSMSSDWIKSLKTLGLSLLLCKFIWIHFNVFICYLLFIIDSRLDLIFNSLKTLTTLTKNRVICV
jgi:hypothetical protein